uniref:Uncharacterized protein n=1 Tax=Rhizophora mucronata TaxID=61149 RepID=A0A2P2IHW5_RHIMU
MGATCFLLSSLLAIVICKSWISAVLLLLVVELSAMVALCGGFKKVCTSS